MLSKNQIKEIQSLQLKKFRNQERLFIVEGVKSVLEIVRSKPLYVSRVIATADFITANGVALKNAGVAVDEVSSDELKKISLQTTPNQVLAVCRYFDDAEGDPDLENGFSFYLDDVRDPGNFGTILRLADWFGLQAVFCSPSSCDLYNPKAIQSSMGAFLRTRVIYRELSEIVASGKTGAVYGALLNGKDLYNEQLTNGLIVIGNEANGINEANLKFINRRIRIPANGNNGTESLNAAMAASIIASEFFRQLVKGAR